jgi:hypothetical protein
VCQPRGEIARAGVGSVEPRKQSTEFSHGGLLTSLTGLVFAREALAAARIVKFNDR